MTVTDERAHELVVAIPQHHVRRAQVLAEHVQRVSAQHKHVGDVGIADRHPLDGRRHVDDATLVERHAETRVARGAHDLIGRFLRGRCERRCEAAARSSSAQLRCLGLNSHVNPVAMDDVG